MRNTRHVFDSPGESQHASQRVSDQNQLPGWKTLPDSVGHESKLLGGAVVAFDILVSAETHEVEREGLGLHRSRVQPILQPPEESTRSGDPVHKNHSMRTFLIGFVHFGGRRRSTPSTETGVRRDYRAG